MGLGLDINANFGTMGVGFNGSEGTPDKYPNLAQMLVVQNLSSTIAYSIWLNDLGKFGEITLETAISTNNFAENGSGSILFGGIGKPQFLVLGASFPLSLVFRVVYYLDTSQDTVITPNHTL